MSAIAPLVLSGFTLGVLGATHCLTMCSGFAALAQDTRRADAGPTIAASRIATKKRSPAYVLLAAQNAGRIGAYALAGFVAGMGGGSLGSVFARGRAVLELAAAALLLAVGLFLVGLLPAYAHLERIGAPLFRAIVPHARRLLPLRTPSQAVLFGVAWGFLPCGLVYSGLALAAVSGSATGGALAMLAFGLGTAPAVVSLGILADQIAVWARKELVRRGAGVVLLVVAIVHFAVASEQLAR
jgi:sulfite exporter TauE/SafE